MPSPIGRCCVSCPGVTQASEKMYYGEFDPGSGRTLAACLTHASQGGSNTDWRTGAEHVGNLPLGGEQLVERRAKTP